MQHPVEDDHVKSVQLKLLMAQYHLDRLKELDKRKYEVDDADLLVPYGAEVEACLHCLHHCLDILGQAIVSAGLVRIRRNRYYLRDVISELPPGNLKAEGELLLMDSEWLVAFANYSKHHNLITIDRTPVLTLMGVIPTLMMIQDFTYGDKRYIGGEAVGKTFQQFSLLRGRLETMIGHLTPDNCG